MIEPFFGFKDSKNRLHATVDLAQASEIALLLSKDADQHGKIGAEEAAATIVAQKNVILDLLTTDENSRPKRRKVNGATRKSRKSKSETTEQPLHAESSIPK